MFGGSMVAAAQAGRAVAGLVLSTALPALSTATHKDVNAHDTPFREFVPASMIPGVLQAGDAPAGLVVIAAFPPLVSTATHNDGPAHETPLSAIVSRCAG